MSEKKSIYREARDEAGMSRPDVEKASGFITVNRLQKIEDEITEPSPEDVVKLQEIYKSHDLCDKYCTEKCAIGKKYKPNITLNKDVSKVIMSMNVALHKLNQDRDRLQEIMLDDKIEDSEIEDFARIQDMLDQLSMLSRSLQIWVEEQVASGNLDGDALKKAKKF